MYYLCTEENVIPVKEHFPVCSVRKAGGQGGAGVEVGWMHLIPKKVVVFAMDEKGEIIWGE